jgi:hypothetical protein
VAFSTDALLGSVVLVPLPPLVAVVELPPSSPPIFEQPHTSRTSTKNTPPPASSRLRWISRSRELRDRSARLASARPATVRDASGRACDRFVRERLGS